MRRDKGTQSVIRAVLVTIYLLTLILVSVPVGQAGAWWDGAWTYRKVLSFNATAVAANETNIPVLVHLTAANFPFIQAKAGGADIRFVDADDATALPYEIEQWTDNTSAFIWVKVPQIDLGTNYTDSIFMYWGNAAAADNQTATAVWNNGFIKVDHMKDGATNAETVNSADPSDNGTKFAAGNPVQAAGKVGLAQDFDKATTGNITYATEAYGEYTFEFVLKLETAETHGILGVRNAVNDGIVVNTFHDYSLQFNLNDGTIGTHADNSGLDDLGWHYVSVYETGVSPTVLANTVIQVDGSVLALDGSVNGVPAAWSVFALGVQNSDFYNGMVDELRVSNVARSASWRLITYLSMWDSFINFGGTDPEPAVATNALASTNLYDKDGTLSGNYSGNLTSLGGTPDVGVWFEYGLTTAYGTSTTNTSRTTTGTFTTAISGLTLGQTYHYLARASNAYGYDNGTDESFTLTLPTVTTLAATNLAVSTGGVVSGNFRGNVTSLGAATDVWAYVQYGPTAAYGSTSSNTTRSATGAFSIAMPSTLQHNTTYHYRVNLVVGGTTINGGDITFTTPAVPSYVLMDTILPIAIATLILVGTVALTGNPIAAFMAAMVGVVGYYIVLTVVRML